MRRRSFLAILATIATAPIAKLLPASAATRVLEAPVMRTLVSWAAIPGAIGYRIYGRGGYVGDGAAEREIVGLGFTPREVAIKPAEEWHLLAEVPAQPAAMPLVMTTDDRPVFEVFDESDFGGVDRFAHAITSRDRA